MQPFKIVRTSGKTNARVIVDLVENAPPGTLFTFSQLIAALGEDTNTDYDINTARTAVYKANHILLEEHKRYLDSVMNAGYRIITAAEHQEIAKRRSRKAERQEHQAMETLRNTRFDEMSQNEKDRHTATLIILESVLQFKQEQKRKNQRHDELIAGLTHRVEQLEGKHN